MPGITLLRFVAIHNSIKDFFRRIMPEAWAIWHQQLYSLTLKHSWKDGIKGNKTEFGEGRLAEVGDGEAATSYKLSMSTENVV